MSCRRVQIFALGTGLLFSVLAGIPAVAGVSRAIQDRYRQEYQNKALFLRIPIFAEKEIVQITGSTHRHQQVPVGAARMKVGDQVRVTGVDFGGEQIRFKVAGISGGGLAEIEFRFDAELQDSFPNSGVFDSAIQATFTEGLKYADLEDAKKAFVEQEFDRTVREIATTAGTTRETVLKTVAPKIPAYQDALKDIDNLQSRNKDISGDLSHSQAENRKLQSEVKAHQAEIARLRSAQAALQEKIDNSTSQLSKIDDELRNARGTSQGYQKEIATLQHEKRDMASQIADLGQSFRKAQANNEKLLSQVQRQTSEIETLSNVKAKLTGDLEDSKATIRKMQDTIATLTSKEDSLARQYLELKKVKENLENVTRSVEKLQTRVLETSTEGGLQRGKMAVLLGNVLLGTLSWSMPEHLGQNQTQVAEARFATESIDYVKVVPDERQLLRSLGDRLKLDLELSSSSPSMQVQAENTSNQELGERDTATWRWKISNTGTQDSRFALDVRFVNRNSDPIPIARHEQMVMSSSVVRQVRNQLQPIPVGIGAVLGFLLFGIAGLFRRARSSSHPSTPEQTENSYVRHKQL